MNWLCFSTADQLLFNASYVNYYTYIHKKSKLFVEKFKYFQILQIEEQHDTNVCLYAYTLSNT